MASPKQRLVHRWITPPGSTIRDRLERYAYETSCRFSMTPPLTLEPPDELLSLLDGLPFRDDIPGGRDLRGISLQNCQFYDLNLSAFDFSYSSFPGPAFIRCRLIAACFDQALIPEASLSSDLQACTFRYADLRRSSFTCGIARNVVLDNARLQRARCSSLDLRGASLRNANCTGVDFTHADLRGADFRDATLDGTIIQGALLDSTTDLRGAKLVNVYDVERRDAEGKIFAAAVDWRVAHIDDRTTYLRTRD